MKTNNGMSSHGSAPTSTRSAEDQSIRGKGIVIFLAPGCLSSSSPSPAHSISSLSMSSHVCAHSSLSLSLSLVLSSPPTLTNLFEFRLGLSQNPGRHVVQQAQALVFRHAKLSPYALRHQHTRTMRSKAKKHKKNEQGSHAFEAHPWRGITQKTLTACSKN